MKSIRIKGSRAMHNWFAEQLVNDHGADGARSKVCGPMLEAVERVIASQERATTGNATADDGKDK